MTDAQILTIAIAIVFPLAMLLYSNSRVGEAKETLRAEIKAETATLQGRIDTGFTQVNAHLDRIEADILRMLADHESRIQKLEGK